MKTVIYVDTRGNVRAPYLPHTAKAGVRLILSK